MTNLSFLQGEKITFDQMPFALLHLINEVTELKNLLLDPSFRSNTPDTDRLLTIKELSDYLPEKPARQTIYGWASNGKISYEKHGSRLYFRKSIIDNWLQTGRPAN